MNVNVLNRRSANDYWKLTIINDIFPFSRSITFTQVVTCVWRVTWNGRVSGRISHWPCEVVDRIDRTLTLDLITAIADLTPIRVVGINALTRDDSIIKFGIFTLLVS